MKRFYKLIGVKIFGIVLAILLLLLLITTFSTLQLKKLNNELKDLAVHGIPITNLISKVDIHVLEQELHANRIFRLYSYKKVPHHEIRKELTGFEDRGKLVDEELKKAIALTMEAVNISQQRSEQTEFKQIEPQLKQIEAEHQLYHDQFLTILRQLQNKHISKALSMERQLDRKKKQFNKQLLLTLQKLEYFTTRAAETAEQHERSMLIIYLLVTAITIIIGLIFAALVATGLTRPIRKLTTGVKKISEGDYDTYIEQKTHDEIGKLSDSFNHMLGELKMKVEIENQFAKHIDPRMVEKIINDPEKSRTGGKKEEMTVFFSDIEGFNSPSLDLSPAEVITLNNRYYDLITAPINEHQGVVDKFIGSTVMAFWGPPFVGIQEHCKLACLAALDQIKSLKKLNELGSDNELSLHIGMATGSLVVGNMGSETSKSFTVMGDTVNIASRLKGAGKQYGVYTLITEQIKSEIQDSIETREIDLIQVVGKDEPVRVFELLGLHTQVDPDCLKLRDLFEQGLNAYRKQQWNPAKQHFQTCLELNRNDKPSQLILERIAILENNPPKKDWDGVWKMTKK